MIGNWGLLKNQTKIPKIVNVHTASDEKLCATYLGDVVLQLTNLDQNSDEPGEISDYIMYITCQD